MLTVNETCRAAYIAADIVDRICAEGSVQRSPEQIALIVDMVNTAMDAMLPLDVAQLEAPAEPLKPSPGKQCHGNPGKLNISVVHEGKGLNFSTLHDAMNFIAENMKGGIKNEIQGN